MVLPFYDKYRYAHGRAVIHVGTDVCDYCQSTTGKTEASVGGATVRHTVSVEPYSPDARSVWQE